MPTSTRFDRSQRFAVLLSCLLAFACGEGKPLEAIQAVPGRVAELAVGRNPDIESVSEGEETRVYYQYIDAKGSVRFVERLADVPAEWRDRVGYVELDSPPPMSPAQARLGRSKRAGQARAAAGRAPPAEVQLYYAEWCPYCRKAKKHLERRGVAYRLRDVDIAAVARELAEKTGQKGVPVIDIDGRILRGYNAARLDEMLSEAKLL